MMSFVRNLCAALLIAPSICVGADAPTIFAAASLSDAVTAVTEKVSPSAQTSFSGSGTLARQIDLGAPADVVILANSTWMDWLEMRGHLREGTRSSPFGNKLVLVGPPDTAPLENISTEILMERLGPTGRLAMGERRAVPAGQYAKIWMEKQGLWDVLKTHLAETDNVRAALTLAARGEVPLAIVYESDLIAAPNAVTRIWTIPDAQQPDIRYEIAALTQTGDEIVRKMTQPGMLAIFADFGFGTGK